MVTISIAYQGDLHCVATHGPSSTELTTDAPADNGGKAESFSPTDLVATALGTCVVTIMGLRAKALDVDIGGTTATVDKEMRSGPRMIARLTTWVRVPHDLPQGVREDLERAAHSCPVHQSLSEKIEKPIEFTWG
jgi:putative redox protein